MVRNAKSPNATTYTVEEKEGYIITYANGMLRKLNLLTEKYGFGEKKETLEFALFVLERLNEAGSVSLKEGG